MATPRKWATTIKLSDQRQLQNNEVVEGEDITSSLNLPLLCQRMYRPPCPPFLVVLPHAQHTLQRSRPPRSSFPADHPEQAMPLFTLVRFSLGLSSLFVYAGFIQGKCGLLRTARSTRTSCMRIRRRRFSNIINGLHYLIDLSGGRDEDPQKSGVLPQLMFPPQARTAARTSNHVGNYRLPFITFEFCRFTSALLSGHDSLRTRASNNALETPPPP